MGHWKRQDELGEKKIIYKKDTHKTRQKWKKQVNRNQICPDVFCMYTDNSHALEKLTTTILP